MGSDSRWSVNLNAVFSSNHSEQKGKNIFTFLFTAELGINNTCFASTGLLSEKEAERRRRYYQKLSCCLRTFCIILVLGIIGITVYSKCCFKEEDPDYILEIFTVFIVSKSKTVFKKWPSLEVVLNLTGIILLLSYMFKAIRMSILGMRKTSAEKTVNFPLLKWLKS